MRNVTKFGGCGLGREMHSATFQRSTGSFRMARNTACDRFDRHVHNITITITSSQSQSRIIITNHNHNHNHNNHNHNHNHKHNPRPQITFTLLYNTARVRTYNLLLCTGVDINHHYIRFHCFSTPQHMKTYLMRGSVVELQQDKQNPSHSASSTHPDNAL